MKSKNFFLAGLIILLLSGTGAAAFTYSNTITLKPDGAVWEYEEHATEKEASFARQLIDQKVGNNDKFVNAWEILNMEQRFRQKLQESIKKTPDLKLNNSSDAVRPLDIEYRISEDALGNVRKGDPVKSNARVAYSFEEGTLRPGTDVWFKGTPESKVKIILPPGLDVNRTKGLETESSGFENKNAVLKGSFGKDGEIRLWLSGNESYVITAAEESGNASEAVERAEEVEKNESASQSPALEKNPDIFRLFDSLKSKLVSDLRI